jgi:hypothetical protein
VRPPLSSDDPTSMKKITEKALTNMWGIAFWMIESELGDNARQLHDESRILL